MGPNTITNTDPGNFQTDGAYIDLVPTSPSAPNGPATGLIAIDGVFNYGKTDTPTPIQDQGTAIAKFGNDTVSENSGLREFLSAMPEGQSFLFNRVTNGEDTAATIVLPCAGLFALGDFVIGGAPTLDDVVSVAINPGSGWISAAPYTVQNGDTTAVVAAAVAQAINATSVASGNTPTLWPAFASGVDVNLAAKAAGVAGNSIGIRAVATGGHTTITPSGAQLTTGAAATGDLTTLTDQNTGSYGDNGALLLTLTSGTPLNKPTFMATCSFPGSPSEVFYGLKGYSATAFDHAALIANLNAAINGTVPHVAGSVRYTAVAGEGVQWPALTLQRASGGEDGSDVTTQDLIGNNTSSNRTGIYAFNGLVSGGQLIVAGLTDPAVGQTLVEFAVQQNCIAHLEFPLGTTPDAAIATQASYDLVNDSLLLDIGWDAVYDSISGLGAGNAPFYVAPAGKNAGIIAGQPSYQYPGNQPEGGCVGVNGTEFVQGGINTIADEMGLLQQAGILTLSFMPRNPRGPQLGLPHGLTSSGALISDIRMLKRIANDLQSMLGPIVGQMMDQTPGPTLGQPAVGLLQDMSDTYFQNLKNGPPKQISTYALNMNALNSFNIVRGFLIAGYQVLTLSAAQYIVAALQVGKTVQIITASV